MAGVSLVSSQVFAFATESLVLELVGVVCFVDGVGVVGFLSGASVAVF